VKALMPFIVGLCLGLSFWARNFVGREQGRKQGEQMAMDRANATMTAQQNVVAIYLLCVEAQYEIPIETSLDDGKKIVGMPEVLEDLKHRVRAFRKMGLEIEARP